jgi:hypothetical protein
MTTAAPVPEPAMAFDPLAPAATWTEQATWAEEALARLKAVHGARWDMWIVPTHPWGYCFNAKPQGQRVGTINVNTPEALEAEIRRQEAWPARERDLSGLDCAELERMHRELVVAAGLSGEGSGGRVMILAEIGAVEAELDGRQDTARQAARS